MAWDVMVLGKGARSTARTTASLIWICGLLMASPAWSEAPAEGALTVSIAAPAYWCPYACDASETHRGFTVEIARAAFESAGHKVEHLNLPYDRALLEVRKGRFDATIPAYKAETPGFVFPAHAVSSSEYCFYVPEDEPWRYTGIDSLQGIRFVATSGYTYGESIDAYIAANIEHRVKLLRGDDIPERLSKMVLMGRYDTLLDDRLLFESSQHSGDLVNAGCLEERHPGYLALSPEDPDRSNAIAEAFDQGFEGARADGRLCAILKKYDLSPRFVPGLERGDCPQ